MKTFTEFINPELQFDWSEFDLGINENNDIEVQMTHHGLERSLERDGKKVNISKSDIEKSVKAGFKKMLQNAKTFKTFVIHNSLNKLNVIGTLLKKGEQWIFKVITVMIKGFFKPKKDDKFIEVQENLEYFIIEI